MAGRQEKVENDVIDEFSSCGEGIGGGQYPWDAAAKGAIEVEPVPSP